MSAPWTVGSNCICLKGLTERPRDNAQQSQVLPPPALSPP